MEYTITDEDIKGYRDRVVNVVADYDNAGVSDEDLLSWVNNSVDLSWIHEEITDLCTGVAYCFLFNQIFPEAVDINRLHIKEFISDTECIANLKEFEIGMNLIQVEHEFQILDLQCSKGNEDIGWTFLSWFKKFYEANISEEGRKLYKKLGRKGIRDEERREDKHQLAKRARKIHRTITTCREERKNIKVSMEQINIKLKNEKKEMDRKEKQLEMLREELQCTQSCNFIKKRKGNKIMGRLEKELSWRQCYVTDLVFQENKLKLNHKELATNEELALHHLAAIKEDFIKTAKPKRRLRK